MAWRSLSFAALLCVVGCAPRLPVGTACSSGSDCAAPLVCRLGRCRIECVSQRDCPLGALCVLDQDDQGSCQLPEEGVCTSSENCPTGLMCIDGACANACTSVLECPAHSRCEAGVDRLARCVRDDLPSDAGVEDVSDDATDAAVCAGPSCDPVRDVELTQRGTCILTESRAVYCWGLRDTTGVPVGMGPADVTCDGRACITTPTRVLFETRPGAIEELADASFLTASQSLDCAVSAGRAVCWGAAFVPLGTSGLGEIARRVRTESDFLPEDVVEIAAGADARFAHRSSAPDHVWGISAFGEFGTGPDRVEATYAIPSTAAVALPAHTRFGGWHGCALDAGRVLCWGENDFGQTGQPVTLGGDPPVADIVSTPTAVAGLPMVGGVPVEVIDVAPGRAHTCALLANGDVWCWGSATLLTNPGMVDDCTAVSGGFACPPRRVFDNGANYVTLASSNFAESACAIDDEGALWCWGIDAPIPGPTSAAADPRRIEGLPPVSHVALSNYHACAIASGELWCWGENDSGQLGNGTWSTTASPVPAPVRW